MLVESMNTLPTSRIPNFYTLVTRTKERTTYKISESESYKED